MKKLVILCLLGLLGFQAFPQTGIGIGSRGINLRTSPDDQVGLLMRTRFGFGVFPLNVYMEPEVAVIGRYHLSPLTRLYGGLGVSCGFSRYTDDIDFGYGGFIPVGLEFFPFREHPRISFSVESGFRCPSFGDYDDTFDHYGLVEVTFYLDDRNLFDDL